MDSDVLNKERVSVLVADIKDYSRLSDDKLPYFFTGVLPDIAEILDNYNTISQNSWGDGIIAFFPEESNSIKCALDIRDLFYNFSANSYGLPETDLDIRIALHTAAVWTGENPIRSKSGFVGSDIALAARIEPIAIPNHIFATNSFAELIPSNVKENNNIEVDPLYSTELAKGWGSEKLCHIRRENEEKITEEDMRRHHKDVQSSKQSAEDKAIQSVLIESNNPEEKKDAIDVLAKRGNVNSMNILENLVKQREDTRADIRAQAAGRLDEFNDPRVIDTLVNVIENDDHYATINNAVACLGNLKNPRAYDTLVNVLKSKEEYSDQARRAAAGSLGKLEDARAVDALVEHLDPEKEHSVGVRERTIDALSLLGNTRAVQPLIDHSISDPDQEIKGKAIEAIGEMGDKRAIDPLSEIIQNREKYSADIRRVAIGSLIQLSDYEATEALVSALDDPSHETQKTAVVALGEINAVSAMDEIEPLLKDVENVQEDLRAACAVSLKKMGQQEAKEALIEALDDPSFVVRKEAIQGIGEAGIVDALPQLEHILTSPEEYVTETRRTAALAIGDLEQADGLPALRDGIEDSGEEVQRSIVQSAAFIDTPESRKFVLDVLNSDKPVPVRAMAAKSLGLSSDDTVAEPLLDILSSEYERRVARGAILALGNLSVDYAPTAITEIASKSSE
ncbi:hypothetical protein DJ71_12625, partial [Halorubrum sp. E3]